MRSVGNGTAADHTAEPHSPSTVADERGSPFRSSALSLRVEKPPGMSILRVSSPHRRSSASSPACGCVDGSVDIQRQVRATQDTFARRHAPARVAIPTFMSSHEKSIVEPFCRDTWNGPHMSFRMKENRMHQPEMRAHSTGANCDARLRWPEVGARAGILGPPRCAPEREHATSRVPSQCRACQHVQHCCRDRTLLSARWQCHSLLTRACHFGAHLKGASQS